MQTPYPGNVFIISAPSGTGKSTLLSRLVDEDERLLFSISHTTRQPRVGEQDGQDYFFVDRDAFEKLIGERNFLEWAKVHDNYYGTAREPIVAALEQGNDIVLDIDVVGAALVKRQMPWALGIFILPPNFDTLKQRLEQRGKDKPEVIENRLRNATDEIRRYHEFDYVIVNDDLETCYQELRTIVAADRLRLCRNDGDQGAVRKIIETFPEKK